MDANTEIRTTTKKGNGLFAKQFIQKGEVVYTLKQDKRVTKQEIPTLTAEEKIHLDQVGENTFEVIGPPGCYVNHACEPNVEERDHTAYALRDIQAGEEISIDYDKIAYIEQPFTCHCGSKKCRGIVKGRNN